MDKLFMNNLVKLTGMIISEPVFDHESNGEKFYRAFLEVKRLSDTEDVIPLLISERGFDLDDIVGKRVDVVGQFRSHNWHDGEKKRLLLNVFVTELYDSDREEDANGIVLDGYVTKEPIYRETPKGREIADILFAVNRDYNKSDYIPCIVWGRNAVYASELPVGTHLKLTGRIQSRNYTKRYPNGTEESRTAYEVSVSKIEEREEEKCE